MATSGTGETTGDLALSKASKSTPSKPSDTPAQTPSEGYVYHEKQLGGLCGVHCINNLLQGPRFGPGDLAEIGVQLDKEEQTLLTEAELQSAYNVDSSADGGNFSIQVLTRALQRFQLELLPAKHPRGRELMKDPPKAADAFLCQYKDHWFAVRKVVDCWWNLNSTRDRPGLVSPFYLSAWLAQLSAEGYSIFIVLGRTLPAPKASSTSDECYHSIFDLLEASKQAGDRPIGGGETNASATQAPSVPSSSGPSASAMDLYAQQQALFGGPIPAGLQDWTSGAWVQHLQTQQGPASRSAAQRRPQTMSFSQWQGESADLSTLIEMGYRDQQIRVAMELCQQKVSRASQLLLRSKGLDASVESSPQLLAAEVQEAVMALDATSVSAEAVLYLATLVSLDKAKLDAASHLDLAVVTELLCGILAKRGQSWPPDVTRGASVVVEILLASPGSRSPEAPAPPRSAAGCFPCRPAGGRGARSSVSVAMPGGDSCPEPQELSL